MNDKKFTITAVHEDGVPFMTFRDNEHDASEMANTLMDNGCWLAVTIKYQGRVVFDWAK
jgi:hypothetical protein